MLKLRLFFSLSLSIIFIYAEVIQDKPLKGTEIHLDRFDHECHGKKNVPFHGYLQGVKTLSGTWLFIKNYTLVLKEVGFKNLMFTITVEKCLSKENLDTCEEHLKQPNMDFCQSLDSKYTNTSNFNFPLVPPFKCPFKKGIHHAYNFTFDLAPFIFYDVNGYYWKYKSEVVASEQNTVIYCTNLNFYGTNTKLLKRN